MRSSDFDNFINALSFLSWLNLAISHAILTSPSNLSICSTLPLIKVLPNPLVSHFLCKTIFWKNDFGIDSILYDNAHEPQQPGSNDEFASHLPDHLQNSESHSEIFAFYSQFCYHWLRLQHFRYVCWTKVNNFFYWFENIITGSYPKRHRYSTFQADFARDLVLGLAMLRGFSKWYTTSISNINIRISKPNTYAGFFKHLVANIEVNYSLIFNRISIRPFGTRSLNHDHF